MLVENCDERGVCSFERLAHIHDLRVFSNRRHREAAATFRDDAEAHAVGSRVVEQDSPPFFACIFRSQHECRGCRQEVSGLLDTNVNDTQSAHHVVGGTVNDGVWEVELAEVGAHCRAHDLVKAFALCG